MTTITLTCQGGVARVRVEGAVTQGMVGIPVQVEWDGAWQGLRKILKVRCGGVERSMELGEEGAELIPWECLVAGQRLDCGLDGWDSDGELRIPTNWACCGLVQPSVADSDGEVPEQPPAPPTNLTEQLLSRVQAAEEGLEKKLSIQQDSQDAGKVLLIGPEGVLTPADYIPGTREPEYRTMGKAALWYRDYDAWGQTIQEAAERLSRFDLIVGGGKLHQESTDEASREKQLAIINLARELNPNIKFFFYFSIASWRNDNGYSHILSPGGIWDEDESAHPGIVRIHSKWEHFQLMERALHIGGSPTEETETVERDYTWEDADGVTHTEDKTITLWQGGIPFDGIFLDDAGMDSAEGIINQGYRNMRQKAVSLCEFAHQRGLSVFVNELNADHWYSPQVSDSNPEGLPAAVDERDFLLVESCHVQTGDADGYPIWRNPAGGPRAVFNYCQNWYPTVGAKVVVNDYPCSSLTKQEREKLLSYCVFNSFAMGAHYLDFNGDLDWEVPGELERFRLQPGQSPTAVNPEDGVFTASAGGHSLTVKRPTHLTQGVSCTGFTLNQLQIILDGETFLNAYESAPTLDYRSDKRVGQIEELLEVMQSSDKKTAGVYHRMLIDDWGKEYVHTNLVTQDWWELFDQAVREVATVASADSETRSIHFTRVSGTQVVKHIYLDAAKYQGHSIEIGVKVNSITPHMFGMSSPSTDWFAIYQNNSVKSTLYPGESYYVKVFTIPEGYQTLNEKYDITVVVNGSTGDEYDFENLYIIDWNEFQDDISKDWYTNLVGSVDTAGSSNNYTPCYTTNKLSEDSFEITWDNPELYKQWSGLSFSIEDPVFVDGHRYEIGCQSFETNLGSVNNNIAFRLNVWSASGSKEIWFAKTHRAESAVFNKEMCCRSFTLEEGFLASGTGRLTLTNISAANTNDQGEDAYALVQGLYVYDLDEENVIFRGEEPSNSFLQICRVTDKKLAEEKRLVGNALYITDSGKLFITDFSGNRIDIVS